MTGCQKKISPEYFQMSHLEKYRVEMRDFPQNFGLASKATTLCQVNWDFIIKNWICSMIHVVCFLQMSDFVSNYITAKQSQVIFYRNNWLMQAACDL